MKLKLHEIRDYRRCGAGTEVPHHRNGLAERLGQPILGALGKEDRPRATRRLSLPRHVCPAPSFPFLHLALPSARTLALAPTSRGIALRKNKTRRLWLWGVSGCLGLSALLRHRVRVEGGSGGGAVRFELPFFFNLLLGCMRNRAQTFTLFFIYLEGGMEGRRARRLALARRDIDGMMDEKMYEGK